MTTIFVPPKKRPQGFAAISPERRREISSMGDKTAHKNGTTLREEAVKLGIPADDFDAIVRPEKMIGPG